MRIAVLIGVWCLWGAARAPAQCDAPIDLGRGPIAVQVPSSYSPERPTPLLVLLHGFGADAERIEDYLRFGPLADQLGLLYVRPEGTPDAFGSLYWDAGVCCGFYGRPVDDVGYLGSLVDAIGAQCNVDSGRIYFLGHSNGAYMSYRMACERSDLVAALVAFAGVSTPLPDKCDALKPVHLLHAHGTADEVWRYEGSTEGPFVYPGAVETATAWAEHARCTLSDPRPLGMLDIDASADGAESVGLSIGASCSANGSVEFWTVPGADHTPAVTDAFRERAATFLLSKAVRCTGEERVAKAVCRRRGPIVVRAEGGTPGTQIEASLVTGERARVELAADGRARAKLPGRRAGAGAVTVRWECGAEETARYRCP